MGNELPQEVKVCLWSYDVDRIDLGNPDHRQRVIENVLNYGTKHAVDWLLARFSKEDIAHAIAQSHAASWNKKSLALWPLVFGVAPSSAARF
jgi:hypothetical protein